MASFILFQNVLDAGLQMATCCASEAHKSSGAEFVETTSVATVMAKVPRAVLIMGGGWVGCIG